MSSSSYGKAERSHRDTFRKAAEPYSEESRIRKLGVPVRIQGKEWICVSEAMTPYQYKYVRYQLTNEDTFTRQYPFKVHTSRTKGAEKTIWTCTDVPHIKQLEAIVKRHLAAFDDAMVFVYNMPVNASARLIGEYKCAENRISDSSYRLEPWTKDLQREVLRMRTDDQPDGPTAREEKVDESGESYRGMWALKIRGKEMETVYPAWEEAVRLEQTRGTFELYKIQNTSLDAWIPSGVTGHTKTENGTIRIPAHQVDQYDQVIQVAIEELRMLSMPRHYLWVMPLSELTPRQMTMIRQRDLQGYIQSKSHGVYAAHSFHGPLKTCLERWKHDPEVMRQARVREIESGVPILPDELSNLLADFLEPSIPFERAIEPMRHPEKIVQLWHPLVRYIPCSKQTIFARHEGDEEGWLWNHRMGTVTSYTLRGKLMSYDAKNQMMYAFEKDFDAGEEKTQHISVFHRYRFTEDETFIYQDSIPMHSTSDAEIQSLVYDQTRSLFWAIIQYPGYKYKLCSITLFDAPARSTVESVSSRSIDWFLSPGNRAVMERGRATDQAKGIFEVVWAPREARMVIRNVDIDSDEVRISTDDRHLIVGHGDKDTCYRISSDGGSLSSVQPEWQRDPLQCAFVRQDQVYTFDDDSGLILSRRQFDTSTDADTFALGMLGITYRDFVFDSFNNSMWVFNSNGALRFPIDGERPKKPPRRPAVSNTATAVVPLASASSKTTKPNADDTTSTVPTAERKTASSAFSAFSSMPVASFTSASSSSASLGSLSNSQQRSTAMIDEGHPQLQQLQQQQPPPRR